MSAQKHRTRGSGQTDITCSPLPSMLQSACTSVKLKNSSVSICREDQKPTSNDSLNPIGFCGRILHLALSFQKFKKRVINKAQKVGVMRVALFPIGDLLDKNRWVSLVNGENKTDRTSRNHLCPTKPTQKGYLWILQGSLEFRFKNCSLLVGSNQNCHFGRSRKGYYWTTNLRYFHSSANEPHLANSISPNPCHCLNAGDMTGKGLAHKDWRVCFLRAPPRFKTSKRKHLILGGPLF